MRWRRLLLRIGLGVGALVAVVGAAALWGLFWPAPKNAAHIACGAHPPVRPCVQISGRVIFHGRFDADHRIHAVLLSRSSVTLPGVTSVEFPPLAKAPAGLGAGDWVSFIGYQTTGSHGEQDIHAFGFATAGIRVRCAGFDGRCTRQRRPGRQSS